MEHTDPTYDAGREAGRRDTRPREDTGRDEASDVLSGEARDPEPSGPLIDPEHNDLGWRGAQGREFFG
jgi:hypothetical protein